MVIEEVGEMNDELDGVMNDVGVGIGFLHAIQAEVGVVVAVAIAVTTITTNVAIIEMVGEGDTVAEGVNHHRPPTISDVTITNDEDPDTDPESGLIRLEDLRYKSVYRLEILKVLRQEWQIFWGEGRFPRSQEEEMRHVRVEPEQEVRASEALPQAMAEIRQTEPMMGVMMADTARRV